LPALRIDPRAAALVLVAAAVAGCGAKAASEGETAEPVGEAVGGSVAALAQCRDWNRGDEASKQATIADIRSSLTPQSSEESGTGFSDESAYELFEHSCKAKFAQSFELYKIYARAAPFAPLQTEP
jgi:hypothetical protein